MIYTKPSVALSVATAMTIAMAFQNCPADTTNNATAGTIDFEFQNAPAFALLEWIPRLTDEPVVVPYNINFLVTYRTPQKVTREEAIQTFENILHTNGYHLWKPDASYYRVAKIAETNSAANRSHIDLEVRGDKVVVNGNMTVDRKDLPKTLATLSNADTEIWVRHPLSGPQAGVADEAMELRPLTGRPDGNKMFLKLVPEGK